MSKSSAASRPDAAHVEAVRAALAPLLDADRAEPPATIPDPFGAGTLHVAVTRFGVGDDHGVLVAGSRRRRLPDRAGPTAAGRRGQPDRHRRPAAAGRGGPGRRPVPPGCGAGGGCDCDLDLGHPQQPLVRRPQARPPVQPGRARRRGRVARPVRSVRPPGRPAQGVGGPRPLRRDRRGLRGRLPGRPARTGRCGGSRPVAGSSETRRGGPCGCPACWWTSPSGSGWRTNCGRPTAARTSSWRRWPTNSATRWPRSATRCKS